MLRRPDACILPRPLPHIGDLGSSFAGLKTAVPIQFKPLAKARPKALAPATGPTPRRRSKGYPLLLWVYLGWVIVLLGAVIAACAPSLQMRAVSIAPTAGWRFELALTLLRQLEAARHSGRHGLSLAAMAVFTAWPARDV